MYVCMYIYIFMISHDIFRDIPDVIDRHPGPTPVHGRQGSRGFGRWLFETYGDPMEIGIFHGTSPAKIGISSI